MLTLEKIKILPNVRQRLAPRGVSDADQPRPRCHRLRARPCLAEREVEITMMGRISVPHTITKPYHVIIKFNQITQ